jgi:hypothetical protein
LLKHDIIVIEKYFGRKRDPKRSLIIV